MFLHLYRLEIFTQWFSKSIEFIQAFGFLLNFDNVISRLTRSKTWHRRRAERAKKRKSRWDEGSGKGQKHSVPSMPTIINVQNADSKVNYELCTVGKFLAQALQKDWSVKQSFASAVASWQIFWHFRFLCVPYIIKKYYLFWELFITIKWIHMTDVCVEWGK